MEDRSGHSAFDKRGWGERSAEGSGAGVSDAREGRGLNTLDADSGAAETANKPVERCSTC